MASGHHEPNALEHTQDSESWHFFDQITESPTIGSFTVPGTDYVFVITKFMILELVAAALLLAIFIPLARRAKDGALPKGGWWNAFDALLTFVRDNIAKPNLGKHADTYVPYLWTVFLFILVCNLLGMVPFMGSPTASIAVTGTLAIGSLLLMHGATIVKYGPIRYVKSMWPHIDAPGGVVISLLIFIIEFLGTFIKSFVLAVRLFANIFAGHVVLATMLIFIYQAGKSSWTIWGLVTTFSVLGVVALSLLELFVAFLQAYVFTFLTALFTGMALEHAEHVGHAEHAH